MKIFDRNHRLFGLINPVDLVVVVLVIAIAFVGYTLLRGKPVVGPVEERSEALVTFVIREIRDTDLGMEIGDEVIMKGVGTIGEVAEVTLVPSQREIPTADGQLSLVESSLFDDATIVVRGQGRLTEGGIAVGDVLLKMNQVIDLRTSRFTAKATVVSVTVAE